METLTLVGWVLPFHLSVPLRSESFGGQLIWRAWLVADRCGDLGCAQGFYAVKMTVMCVVYPVCIAVLHVRRAAWK